nr:hypothetical protein [Terriglobales bacterium]
NLGDGTDVNEEGQFKGSGHSKKDIAIIAGGAGSGMLFGGLIGGGPGVAIGGAIGAGAGTTRWLIERRSANLPAGTELFLELNRPVTIGAEPVAGQ